MLALCLRYSKAYTHAAIEDTTQRLPYTPASTDLLTIAAEAGQMQHKVWHGFATWESGPHRFDTSQPATFRQIHGNGFRDQSIPTSLSSSPASPYDGSGEGREGGAAGARKGGGGGSTEGVEGWEKQQWNDPKITAVPGADFLRQSRGSGPVYHTHTFFNTPNSKKAFALITKSGFTRSNPPPAQTHPPTHSQKSNARKVLLLLQLAAAAPSPPLTQRARAALPRRVKAIGGGAQMHAGSMRVGFNLIARALQRGYLSRHVCSSTRRLPRVWQDRAHQAVPRAWLRNPRRGPRICSRRFAFIINNAPLTSPHTGIP